MNPFTPIQLEAIERAQVLAEANAHAAALCWAFLYACAAAVVLIGGAYLIRAVLDAWPFTLCHRVDNALRADNAPKNQTQPIARRRAA